MRRRRWLLVPMVGATAACGVVGTVLRDAPSGSAGPDAGADGSAELDAPGTGTEADAEAGGAYDLSAGQGSTCALVPGRAFCWGDNSEGELGTGTTQSETSPTAVATSAVFDRVVVGDVHACGLESGTGRIDCWGGDDYGQLGVAAATPAPTAVLLPGIATEVTAGYEFTCAVLGDGALWCWGENDEGQLGQNDAAGAASSSTPLSVAAAQPWLAVSGGQGHACGVQSPGTMWCWGRNTTGQLGQGPGAPIQIRAPVAVGTDATWRSLDLGQDTACAIQQDGTLWCWGDDASNELGFVAPADDAGVQAVYVPTQVGSDADWAQVSVDAFHGCAVKTGGTLWCWGRNVEGQLGLGDTVDRDAPTQVGAESTWSFVSAGRFHTCAERLDHTLACAGADDSGQLGIGSTDRADTLTTVTLPK